MSRRRRSAKDGYTTRRRLFAGLLCVIFVSFSMLFILPLINQHIPIVGVSSSKSIERELKKINTNSIQGKVRRERVNNSDDFSSSTISPREESSASPEMGGDFNSEPMTSKTEEAAPGNMSSAGVYITVNSKGKLGNQMFQYATLYCLTKTNSPWTPYLKGKKSYFNLLKTFRGRLTIGRLAFTPTDVLTINVMENPNADAVLEMLKRLPTDRNITVMGYFQSYKFFDGCRDDIRSQFDFSDAWKRSVQRQVWRNTPPSLQDVSHIRVGIHVRRTSMIISEKLDMGYISPPLDYFRHAMEHFRSLYDRVLFVVAGDDVDWCKANLRAEYIVFVQSSVANDLLMLGLSEHVITSVGTFSWWAGWFNSGTTVYYGLLPENDTYAGKLYANNSYIPPDDEFNHWLAIV
ncbi:hypothetical protein LSH36_168g03066 [Paralvinella palmiformis]|uniref:L-Fucosyltransferase n=1 Tax=Paralvinella palmiformis TaxID=53620 RepID=A0AAD9JSQ6_9ANNE|nr:hypothetical protein LSH36_168g03066 [Paralvinella palmiformis]